MAITVSSQAWTQGDFVEVRATIKSRDTGLAIDVTGHTIAFIHWFNNDTPLSVAGTIVTAGSGIVKYLFATGLADFGALHWTWRTTDGSGQAFNSDEEFTVIVRRRKVA